MLGSTPALTCSSSLSLSVSPLRVLCSLVHYLRLPICIQLSYTCLHIYSFPSHISLRNIFLRVSTHRAVSWQTMRRSRKHPLHMSRPANLAERSRQSKGEREGREWQGQELVERLKREKRTKWVEGKSESELCESVYLWLTFCLDSNALNSMRPQVLIFFPNRFHTD